MRVALLMVLSLITLGSTSGCGVAESLVLTTHMRHDVGVRDYEPGEIKAKEPRRTPDVPPEAATP